MTPEQRRLRAQNAANARWSKHMAREDQAYVARPAIYDGLAREVDPDGKIPPGETSHPRPERGQAPLRQAQRRQGP
jgi:hypothetical protein